MGARTARGEREQKKEDGRAGARGRADPHGRRATRLVCQRLMRRPTHPMRHRKSSFVCIRVRCYCLVQHAVPSLPCACERSLVAARLAHRPATTDAPEGQPTHDAAGQTDECRHRNSANTQRQWCGSTAAEGQIRSPTAARSGIRSSCKRSAATARATHCTQLCHGGLSRIPVAVQQCECSCIAKPLQTQLGVVS